MCQHFSLAKQACDRYQYPSSDFLVEVELCGDTPSAVIGPRVGVSVEWKWTGINLTTLKR